MTATGRGIKNDRLTLGKAFSELWYRIPEYQRQYVWGAEQVENLLDDTMGAMRESPDSDYFLGTLVLKRNEARDESGTPYEEYAFSFFQEVFFFF